MNRIQNFRDHGKASRLMEEAQQSSDIDAHSSSLLSTTSSNHLGTYINNYSAFYRIQKDRAAIPENLVLLLKKYAGSNKGNLTIEYKDLTIATPTVKCMEEICLHYKNKYNIQIECCYVDNLMESIQNFRERRRTDDGSCQTKYKGIVFCGEQNQDPDHVIPLILHYCSEDNTLEILDLDPVHNERLTSYLTMYGILCQIKETILIKTPDGRQADLRSCRTGALVLLRNALNDLHNRDAATSLRSVTETEEIDAPYSSLSHQSTMLPLSWTYSEQILLDKAPFDLEIPWKSGITALALQKSYQFSVEQIVGLDLRLDKLNPHPDKETLSTWNRYNPKRLKVSEEPFIFGIFAKGLHIEVAETREQNLYLLLKGLQYVGLIGKRRVR